jgi:hypothetical protein
LITTQKTIVNLVYITDICGILITKINNMYYEHCEIKTPEDNIIIWRYMNIEKFLSILENSELFFSRLDALEDKYEGHLPKKNKDIIVNLINKKNIIDHYLFLKKHCHVNCWHMNDEESVSMWSSYAPGNSGIAIKSTIGRLKKAFKDAVEDIIIGPVSYIDYDNDSIKEDSSFATSFYKRKNYKSEQEVRAFTSTMSNCTLNSNGGYNLENETVASGISIKIDLSLLIEKIYVHPNAPIWFYELIKSIMKRYGYSSIEVMKSDI